MARYTPRNFDMQLPGPAALCPTLRVVRPSIEHALVLRPQAVTLDREIDVEKKEATSATAAKGDVRTELDDLKQALDKATDSTQRQVTRSRSALDPLASAHQSGGVCCFAHHLQVAITKLNQKMIKDLEAEISGFKSESMKQRKMLYTLEKEREKYGAEASDANAKFGTALEEAWRRPLDRASRRIARARALSPVAPLLHCLAARCPSRAG